MRIKRYLCMAFAMAAGFVVSADIQPAHATSANITPPAPPTLVQKIVRQIDPHFDVATNTGINVPQADIDAALTAAAKHTTAPCNNDLAGKTLVILDPGHGMQTPEGTDIGSYINADASELRIINLVAPVVGKTLGDEGYAVAYTRPIHDIFTLKSRFGFNVSQNNSLVLRTDFAKALLHVTGASHAIFVSMHVNEARSDRNVQGAIVFSYSRYETNKSPGDTPSCKLAACIADSYGISGVPTKQKGENFAVLRNSTNMPAILIEMGFDTNASDLKHMSNDSDKIGHDIANGITKYLKTIAPAPTPSAPAPAGV